MAWISLPTPWTIRVLELTAKPLPTALPPTVRPAAKADISSEMICGQEQSKFARMEAAMVADALPDTTPQISPTTSLQIELTR